MIQKKEVRDNNFWLVERAKKKVSILRQVFQQKPDLKIYYELKVQQSNTIDYSLKIV